MRLSVVIPCYNMGKYLKRCLDSISNQRIDDYEVICINDGSTDNTVDIFNSFKYAIDGTDLHPEFRMITQQNQGVSVARNSGIDIAKGDYISFVDPDDEVADGGLKALLDCADRFDNPDWVIGGYQTVLHDGRTVENIPSSEIFISGDETAKWIYENVYGEFLGAPWAKIFKHSTLYTNNLHYSLGMIRHQDTEFNLRFIPFVTSVVLSPNIIYKYYKFNPEGASGSFKGQRQIDALNTFYQTECNTIDKLFTGEKQTYLRQNALRKLSYCFLSAIYILYNTKNINRLQSLKMICNTAEKYNPQWTEYFNSGNPRIMRIALKMGYLPTHCLMSVVVKIPALRDKIRG